MAALLRAVATPPRYMAYSIESTDALVDGDKGFAAAMVKGSKPSANCAVLRLLFNTSWKLLELVSILLFSSSAWVKIVTDAVSNPGKRIPWSDSLLASVIIRLLTGAGSASST